MAYEIRMKVTNQIPVCIEVIDMLTIEEYPFVEVTTAELIHLRLSKKPGVVYKRNGKLYYASVPGDLKISGKESDFDQHLCGKNCHKVCDGCPRTHALTVSYQKRLGKKFVEAVRDSWRIEKFNFIDEGVEAFNMYWSNDAFIVLKCNKFC